MKKLFMIIRNLIVTISLLACLFCLLPTDGAAEGKQREQGCTVKSGFENAGRYKKGENVIYILVEDCQLMARPIFWHSNQPLIEASENAFVVFDRKERSFVFGRRNPEKESGGAPDYVSVKGFGDDGDYQRLSVDPTPVEMLLSGEAQQASEILLKNYPDDLPLVLGIGRSLLFGFPSKAKFAVVYFKNISEKNPKSAKVFELLADAYIAVGERGLAAQTYIKANKLDPENSDIQNALFRLNLLPPDTAEKSGWKIPFSLDDLFKPPTKKELKRVKQNWAGRDLSVKDVVIVASGKINFENTEAAVTIVSHRVHGKKHFGAVIIPERAGNEKLPVIVDLKGVSWNYQSLKIENGSTASDMMGDRKGEFIYVVPSFRGEILEFDGKTYESEGDRTDSWDGAADDALALLNVALATFPEADPDRVCVFGKSRGGSVALLVGIRDKRIKCVVDWAGPVDWFSLMGLSGWSQQELVKEGLRIEAKPNQTGGQFIERYLKKPIEGREGLEDSRLRMIAGSPIYFASLLPRAQLHYGIDDYIVPVINGKALLDELRKSKKDDLVESFFYPLAGHDLDPRKAAKESRRFIVETLLSKGRNSASMTNTF